MRRSNGQAHDDKQRQHPHRPRIDVQVVRLIGFLKAAQAYHQHVYRIG